MPKKAFLIHGWQGHPEEEWRPWLRNELESLGWKVILPAMPDTMHPKVHEWVRHTEHLVNITGGPDENCYFVGHSLGCIAILRYLETLSNEKVGGAILVAGFSDDLGYEEFLNFFTAPILWDEIKTHCKKFVAIHSDNDPYVPLEQGNVFKEKLGAELIIEHNMKHYSAEDGITELPIALEVLLRISK